MPETTVTEHGYAVPRQDEVRGASRGDLPVEPEPEVGPVYSSAQGDLRTGVPYAAPS